MVFGGIVRHFGTLSQPSSSNKFVVTVPSDISSTARLGDSIALNGVCLTVTNIDENQLSFDLSDETLRVTTLSKPPKTVHVESALRYGDAVGGHVISGHVHGTGVFTSLDTTTGEMNILLPRDSFKVRPIFKDSIAVDGVSLTVAQVQADADSIVIALIPHTIKHTLFATMAPGTPVNIELNVKTLQRAADYSDGSSEKKNGQDDVFWMRKAIEEGEKGRHTAPPNPWVGAILVNPWGSQIGAGYHSRPGAKHAEREIEAPMGGCTLYVTLEPCSHVGRTPPCIEFLVEQRPARIVVGTLDPDERVAGKGVDALIAAGIPVTVGVAEDEVKHSLRAYLWHRSNQHTPYVVCKLGVSQDNCYGYTTDTEVQREWITGTEARRHSHGLRASSQRIVVGKHTMNMDKPQLNVRYDYTVDKQPEKVVSTRALEWLKSKDDAVVQVLVEGGPELEDDLLRRNLVNEFVLYRSSKILGLNGVRWNPSFKASEWKLVETKTFSDGDTMQRFLCKARQSTNPAVDAKDLADDGIQFDSIDTALETLRAGELIVVMDDESRENEGDLMVLADRVTSRTMKTILALTTGIVCATMTQARANQLALPLMVAEKDNMDAHRTKFTLSVDAAAGITTGVCAADRVQTLNVIAGSATTPKDLARPGHVFPLVAAAGGLLERQGHTEAGVELARMTGCMEHPVMVISELYDHGTGKMMSAMQCRQLGFPMIHIKALVARLSQWSLSAAVPLQHHDGDWRLSIVAGCKIVMCGDALNSDVRDSDHKRRLLLRIHSECFTGDVLGSALCDCGEQLHGAMHDISRSPSGGLIIFPAEQEGRGIGLVEKVKVYSLQREQGLDTFAANQALGHGKDLRNYDSVLFALRHIGVLPETHHIDMLTENPTKIKSLVDAGYDVSSQAMESDATHHNARYMKDKHAEFVMISSSDAPPAAAPVQPARAPVAIHPSKQLDAVAKQSKLMKQAPTVIALTSLERQVLQTTQVVIVQAEWHKHMSTPLIRTIENELLRHYGIPSSNIRCVPCPGSFELPRVIQHLASRDPAKGALTIYVAVGILVKGNTDHYDLVARETTSAIMRLGLDQNLWVVNAVLACHNMTQVEERCMEEYDHCVGPHMAQAVARLSLLARS